MTLLDWGAPRADLSTMDLFVSIGIASGAPSAPAVLRARHTER